jgi:biopolymer transport protein ExbB
MRPWAVVAVAMGGALVAFAQGDAAALGSGDAVELVSVDWLAEMRQGGATMVALFALSVIGLGVLFERLFAVRGARFAPQRVLERVGGGDAPGAAALCAGSRSMLGETMRFALEHRSNPLEQVSEAVGDMAGRFVADHEQQTAPLATVAALAPLLGLLGTMIGMIESFKLVEVFGDEGGASMLAGSISKALITTAAGLVIAIPTLGVHYWIRHRIHKHAMRLETDLQAFLHALYLKRTPLLEKDR